jgi:exo-beta-1,3-glucanase (GH17 family)
MNIWLDKFDAEQKTKALSQHTRYARSSQINAIRVGLGELILREITTKQVIDFIDEQWGNKDESK